MSLVTMTGEFKALMEARRGGEPAAETAETVAEPVVEAAPADVLPAAQPEPPAIAAETPDTADHPELSRQKLKCFGRRPFVFEGALLFSLTVPLKDDGPGLTLELYESKENLFFASLALEESSVPPRVYAAPSIGELKATLSAMDPTVFLPVPYAKVFDTNDPKALAAAQKKLTASIELAKSTFHELLSRIFSATSNRAA